MLGLVVLAVVAALVWLHTGGGARGLGQVVTNQARDAIRGGLSVRTIEVRGLLNICANGVDLRDPDGNEVMRAERICVHVNPIALKANKVLLRDVQVVRPWIDVATVQDAEGKPTTTLARALAPRKPPVEPEKQSGPLKWVIDVTQLALTEGSISMRPAPKAAPGFALEGVGISAAHARYAADGADARVRLSGELTAPGRDPVALDLDALLTGTSKTGKAEVRSLKVALGQTGFTAQGRYDLGARTGELHLRELRVLPADLGVLTSGKPPALSGEVRGEADLRMEGGAVAQVARRWGDDIPVVNVRCLSDLAGAESHLDFRAFLPVASRYALREQRIVEAQLWYTRLDDKRVFLAIAASPLFNEQNQLVGAIALLRDVTEQQREQERAQQADKLRALGQLASGVAHNHHALQRFKIQFDRGGVNSSMTCSSGSRRKTCQAPSGRRLRGRCSVRRESRCRSHASRLSTCSAK